MDAGRRFFLTAFVPQAVFVGAGFVSSGSMSARALQVPSGPPPQNPNPASRPILPAPGPLPSTAQLRQNQRDIRKDVDQLFDLAQELKSMSSKSDAAQELSVALIQKTEEIEKLAKKIRDLARS
jgi:hypothetical protein